jgi:CelD/BcsL family acetyltransferase involved in cellulose biosynthesis
MTYRYQRAWWQHLGRGELVLIAIRADDNRLVGLAPLFCTLNEKGQRQLNFVGCVDVSDYLDLLVDKAYLPLVQQALLDYLEHSPEIGWDVLSLCSLPHNSLTHTHLAEAARDRGWQVTVQEQDVCPVITLPESWETYLAGINKKQRHEIRRKMRKLETETEARWYVVDSAPQLAAAMSDFIDLHRKSARDKKDFWDEDLTQFFYTLAEELAETGYLKLFFLELNQVKAAALLCFDYDNQFLLYNSGYDPDLFAHLSPGNVLVSYTIEEAMRLGRTRYDFLRGDEIYKFRFGAEAEPVYDLEISKSG